MVLSSTVFGFWGALFLLDDHESGRSVTAGVSPSPVAGGYLPRVCACWKAILVVASWRVAIGNPESEARSRITLCHQRNQ